MGLFRRRGPEPRPPVADLSEVLDVQGESWPLADLLVAARVDAGRLSVELYHPSFADPRFPTETRLAVAQELLVAVLGERGARQVVHRLTAVTFAPIDAFSAEALRAFARSLGADVDPPAAEA
ncbi:hypothetical protein [Nocardioides marmoraquaticus]